MAQKTQDPPPADPYDPFEMPGFDDDFIDQADLDAFARALFSAPETDHVTALNDWRPVYQRVRRKHHASRHAASASASASLPSVNPSPAPSTRRRRRPRKTARRTKDETREGISYTLAKWPLLWLVFTWLGGLSIVYACTRLYIWAYEHAVTWRGRRNRLRKEMRATENYDDWVSAAKKLDQYLGNDKWRETDEYAYYDYETIRKVLEQLRERRQLAEREEKKGKLDRTDSRRRSDVHVNGTNGVDVSESDADPSTTLDELRALLEACIKSNFAGIENPRLYSETYYGTKDLVQEFIDELGRCLSFLLATPRLTDAAKAALCRHLHTNLGRTALCLSGGASFAYYHFGVAKALLDADVLPDVVAGTSGGALVAALVGTRTDAELRRLLVPALAHRIDACAEPLSVWMRRWWRTGARFDSLDWAKKCAWFCRGSNMTFREAYERTGRILNVTCVPADPHSPSILANYLTAPNCVVWSAVLASAAVPGILNPVVLMSKDPKDGKLVPHSFGHKWKDGSLRTDVPLRALNQHFNAHFSIVSQVNPHISLFFFSARGTVGRPVTHRKGRGWRGGFLGSAVEQYLKLDLKKWLKLLRHLELLPRPLGQDWSEIWLQPFTGTVTIWPRTRISDFPRILSDPDPKRLAQMLHAGQQSAFPKLLFIKNRMKIERLIEKGLLLVEKPDIISTAPSSVDGTNSSAASENGAAAATINRHNSLHLHGQELRSRASAARQGIPPLDTDTANSYHGHHHFTSTSSQPPPFFYSPAESRRGANHNHHQYNPSVEDYDFIDDLHLPNLHSPPDTARTLMPPQSARTVTGRHTPTPSIASARSLRSGHDGSTTGGGMGGARTHRSGSGSLLRRSASAVSQLSARGGVVAELMRQTSVFWDDDGDEAETDETGGEEEEEGSDTGVETGTETEDEEGDEGFFMKGE